MGYRMKDEHMNDTLPAVLRGIVPEIGTVWEWEPLKDYARQKVRVTAVTWNGDECWVTSELLNGTDARLNELSRWVEATVLVTVSP